MDKIAALVCWGFVLVPDQILQELVMTHYACS